MRNHKEGILHVATLCLALAIIAASRPAAADDAFGSAVAVEDLATLRGGDDSNSHNVISTSTSTQETNATNQNNTITAGGDAIAGAISVDSSAFTDMHGMSNVVMNTAPMANVQGIMSLNLVLH